MQTLSIGCVLAALLALGGCATAPQAQALAGQRLAAASAASDDEAPMTGTRLSKRKTTDRMVRSVGAQDARNALDSAPDPLRSGE